MKIRFKLSICVITIMAVMVTGINILLLWKASEASYHLGIRSLEHLTSYQAEFWQSRQEGYVKVLYTLANIMGDYESINAQQRRDRYDDMLKSAVETESEILTLYTVWKPNAIDGMDASFIGRTGSSPEGQYAISYSKGNGRIKIKTSYEINNVMAHINGSNADKDCVDNPITQRVNGKDMFVIKILVPIINQRTGEAVGGLGCFMVIDTIQQIAEKTINTNNEIAMMALYSDNGTILAHSNPDCIGKLIFDADAGLGDSGKIMYEAAQNGKSYRDIKYVPVLNEKIIFAVKPFTIGNSDHNWSMLIGVSESYILNEVRAIAGFTAVLTIIAILAAAVIFLIILKVITKPTVKVTDALENIPKDKNLSRLFPQKRNEKIAGMSRNFDRNTVRIRRFPCIPAHTGGITLFPLSSRLASRTTKLLIFR
jgi:methyl-accepting chemotaxis protein